MKSHSKSKRVQASGRFSHVDCQVKMGQSAFVLERGGHMASFSSCCGTLELPNSGATKHARDPSLNILRVGESFSCVANTQRGALRFFMLVFLMCFSGPPTNMELRIFSECSDWSRSRIWSYGCGIGSLRVFMATRCMAMGLPFWLGQPESFK